MNNNNYPNPWIGIVFQASAVVLVAVWAAREFMGRDVPSDVALAALTGIVYGVEWALNRLKHGWKR